MVSLVVGSFFLSCSLVGRYDKKCLAHLDKGRVKVEIVRHDHSSNDSHSLKKGVTCAVFAVREEHSFDDFTLLWGSNHILKKKSGYD